MLTEKERNTLAAALALALEFGDDTPDVGITDWDDRVHVWAVCRAIVDELPEDEARLRLIAIRSVWAEHEG